MCGQEQSWQSRTAHCRRSLHGHALLLTLPVAKLRNSLLEVELLLENEGMCRQPSPVGLPSSSLRQQQTQQTCTFSSVPFHGQSPGSSIRMVLQNSILLMHLRSLKLSLCTATSHCMIKILSFLSFSTEPFLFDDLTKLSAWLLWPEKQHFRDY